MTETRRPTLQSTHEFALDALRQIADARLNGAQTPEDIAEALNRGGFPAQTGHQWNAETVLGFLASKDALEAQQELDNA